MNNIAPKNLCCGCAGCSNACPKDAITMQENNEGFLYPVIDESKCINCQICTKICPVLNPKYKNPLPSSYAVMADDKIRAGSTSGGVFPVLAYYFLKNAGYIAGAVWQKDGSVKHIVSNKKEDIEAMRGSKYLQSSIGNCFSEVKTLLDSNRKLLFTGTPCQIAGLNAFLKKDYDNLYTVEVICHGVPSPGVFKKYLDENLNGASFVSTDFRDKSKGWGSSSTITTVTEQFQISQTANENDFMKAFLKILCLRESCGQCIFNRIPRQADITIGDFWGVWKYNKKLDDKKGTSVVFINNPKGAELFNNVRHEFKLTKRIPFKKAIKGNPNVIGPTHHHAKRTDFFKLKKENSLRDTLAYCLDNRADCMILNFWYAINYGASLTCYGVQCLAERFGLTAKVINYIPRFEKKYPNSFSEKFARKYLNLTLPVNDYNDFIALNLECSTFITGSDQVFNPELMSSHHKNSSESIYLLDFVKRNNRKLSYAASFGNAEFNGTWEQKLLFKHFLNQFDSISVREDDGINILDELGIQANKVQLIDAVFLIERSKLEQMTAAFAKKEKYIACFLLPYFKKETWSKKLLSELSQKLNMPVKMFPFDQNISVEEWLAFIKNSDFVVTDSFHGTAFSIIFNRPFLQIKNSPRQSRFESLCRLLNISLYSVSKDDVVDFSKIQTEINWDKVNQKIAQEVIRAEKWFEIAIKTPVKTIIEPEFADYNLIKLQLLAEELKNKANLLKNHRKIKFKYHATKFVKLFAWGKSRKKFKAKIQRYKTDLNAIKKI